LYTSLALDAAGYPHISYYDATCLDLKYASIPGQRLAVVKHAAPDPVLSGAQLAYTLRLTNTGTVSLTATITDILPDHVMPGGLLIWTPPPLVPDDAWTETVIVTVDAGYTGLLTNVVQVTTEEGARGVYTETSSAIGSYYVYLPLVLRND
jgi:uncharacterized repeat protein (TIGR01451 family)